MTKQKPKIYAKALVELILEDKKGTPVGLRPRDITEKFFALLQKNGDLKKAKEIIALAETLLLKKTGNKKITIEVARKSAGMVFPFKKGDMVQQKIRPEMIAGVKIIIDGERQLDFSLKNKLEKIFT